MSQKNGLTEAMIRDVVLEVLGKLPSGSVKTAPGAPSRGPKACSSQSRFGVFQDAGRAAKAAQIAFEQLKTKGLSGRAKVVEIVKTLCWDKAREWGKIEFEETRIGRLDHKIEKLQGIKGVLGVESLLPLGLSGDNGITMEENAPWGVILAITPVTHSIPTIAGNIINMVAAGNAMVVNPHPGGAKCAAIAVKEINQAIHAELGIENLVCIMEKPSLETFRSSAPRRRLPCFA